MNASNAGKLVILSGPSGAGKSTVVRELLATCPLPLELSVSATTRLPRAGERDGVDYHFLSREEFALRRERGEFLECKEVFGRGDWYGTLAAPVTAGLRAGKWVLLEIDVEGRWPLCSRIRTPSPCLCIPAASRNSSGGSGPAVRRPRLPSRGVWKLLGGNCRSKTDTATRSSIESLPMRPAKSVKFSTATHNAAGWAPPIPADE